MPMKRGAWRAKQGLLIDLTFGNACQSVVFFDSGMLHGDNGFARW